LATYIANNAAAILGYSERWLNGERISTAFVESTVNLMVSRRFEETTYAVVEAGRPPAPADPQPDPRRDTALSGMLRDLFTRWYPNMAANDNDVALSTAAA
jgi:hypothetical protein